MYKLNRSVFHNNEYFFPDDETGEDGDKLAIVCSEIELADYLKRDILVLVSEGTPEEEEKEITPIPINFPGREILVANGITTLETIVGMTDAQLRQFNGIGPATLEDIRDSIEVVE